MNSSFGVTASGVIQGSFGPGQVRGHHAAVCGARPPSAPASSSLIVQTARGYAQHMGCLRPHASAPGKTIPPELRPTLERLFQTDLADVRIHISQQPSTIGSLAFTHGSDIYVAPDQFHFGSPHGGRLLGHELTHVVQQRAGRVRNPFGRDIALVYDQALEFDADRMAAAVCAACLPPTMSTAHASGFSNAQAVVQPQAQASTSRAGLHSNGSVADGQYGGFPAVDIRMYGWTTGGKEKDIYRISHDKAAAVSKTGDLRRIQAEVGTLKKLAQHNVPTVNVSDVSMFRVKHHTSLGFLTDWVENSVDSNANRVGFDLALRRLHRDQRITATRDLDTIQQYVNHFGGILDLQALVETTTGRLRVLDPRGQTRETVGSFTTLQDWRRALER